MSGDARRATAELGAWVAALTWADVPARVQSRLSLVLLDVLGACAAGACTPEQRALVAAWDPAPGPVPLIGGGRRTGVEAAAWLNGTAMVCLELDEGNKYARGHPAAHGFPAVLALAAASDADGPATAAALLAAYETAARFGRATTLRAGAHPHGSWGVAGAAAGCARLLGLDAGGVAAAIDTGAGLPVAGHFASALDGNPVRDAWMGAAGTSGLAAARMAAAGLARNTGTAAYSLGGLLGGFDAAELTAELGTRWDVELGYFKRHASCSFTHPAADAVLELRPALAGRTVEEITVETNGLSAGLDRTTWDGRLAAMFSIPFVVASALVRGRVDPAAATEPALHDPEVAEAARRVRVERAPDLDARLPAERAVRVTVRTADGARHVRELPNPVGDVDHRPLDENALLGLLDELLGDRGVTARLHACATRLPDAPAVGALLGALAEP
ncbi:MmgE/PrpD family protein [Actinomadura sp. DC4]|uniref:MmgE/PrpD family protein n=1 Tax=Actinomadura sp. DC4 TaxID=3055069 RepID=UPI0025B23691|nr:MmgE/PrpD family protein [Actinomadura sp. DC4]MDN3356420.1 MmgE/PrpD family protein [Actinomadura sp. DC4]